jgi:hypothetical protein
LPQFGLSAKSRLGDQDHGENTIKREAIGFKATAALTTQPAVYGPTQKYIFLGTKIAQLNRRRLFKTILIDAALVGALDTLS